jgi:hypothetical protein
MSALAVSAAHSEIARGRVTHPTVFQGPPALPKKMVGENECGINKWSGNSAINLATVLFTIAAPVSGSVII